MIIQVLRQFTKRKWREKREGEGEGKRGEGRKGEQHSHNCGRKGSTAGMSRAASDRDMNLRESDS